MCVFVNAFQFTPLREGRRIRAKRSPQAAYFNSRPSARGDDSETTRSRSVSISIHAPPRGATRYEVTDAASGEFQFTPLREGRPNAFSTLSVLVYFNSRPSARGDGASSSSTGGAALFQFTPLREGRLLLTIGIISPVYFNSRPSARGDDFFGLNAEDFQKFQFTPLREGRRWPPDRGRNPPPISIHAPPRGATSRWPPAQSSPSYFNSRPSARGD